MIEAALIAIAAAWRAWDGTGYGPTWLRSIAGLTVALTAAWVSLGPSPWVLFVALVAWASMISSVSKFISAGWQSWWMAARYAVPAVVIVLPGWYGAFPLTYDGGLYIGLCVVGGIVYPLAMLSRRDLARLTEAVVGATVIGGLAVL